MIPPAVTERPRCQVMTPGVFIGLANAGNIAWHCVFMGGFWGTAWWSAAVVLCCAALTVRRVRMFNKAAFMAEFVESATRESLRPPPPSAQSRTPLFVPEHVGDGVWVHSAEEHRAYFEERHRLNRVFSNPQVDDRLRRAWDTSSPEPEPSAPPPEPELPRPPTPEELAVAEVNAIATQVPALTAADILPPKPGVVPIRPPKPEPPPCRTVRL